LNISLYIANRLSFFKRSKKALSDSVLNIAVGVVAVGMAVMLVTVSVVTGFKNEIYKKIVGFQSHITVKNRDVNETYETEPISSDQFFYPSITEKDGIEQIHVFATKPGIIKAESEVHGIILKGVGSDYSSEFIYEHIIRGNFPKVDSVKKTKDILISEKTADLLGYKVDDKIDIYFIQEPPKARRFIISGLYKTGMEELDKATAFCDIRHIISINDWDDDQISGFEILIDDLNNTEALTKIVEDEVSGMVFNDGSMLEVSNFMRDNSFIVQWLRLSDTNVYVILTLMIIVSVLSMTAALLVIILERTNMIGILKSLGAENSKIISIFMWHGSYLIAKGMIIGNVIGAAILLIQKYLNLIPLDPKSYYVDSVPVNFNFTDILFLNFGVLLISSIVLLLPALTVAKINPAKTVNFK
jgi:lipoprotein-releasing system permease protein